MKFQRLGKCFLLSHTIKSSGNTFVFPDHFLISIRFFYFITSKIYCNGLIVYYAKDLSGNITQSAPLLFKVNTPPVANAGLDQTVLVSKAVSFSGSGSSDPDGNIVSYAWDFGDSTTSSGISVTHTYAAPGTYTVTLTVTDNDGATDNDTCMIKVSSVEQTPWKTNANGILTTNMNWNYTMGYHFTPQKSGQITKLGGLFNGTKTVYLWNKTTGALLAQATVSSSNSWNYAAISPVSIQAGVTYTVGVYLAGSGGSSYFVSNNFPQIYIDIKIEGSTYISGNGRPINNITSTMYGQVDIEFVSSTNNPPVLNTIGSKSVNEGQLLQFTISATDPDGDTLTYSTSNLPSGATFNASTKTFSWTPNYTQSGTYSGVHFEVSDGKTGVDSEDITITVTNVPQIPKAPSNPTATAVSNSQINLSWTDNSSNETGFKIKRKTGVTGTYSQIATVGDNVISYSNTGLTSGTTYYYRVRAYNTEGDSNYSSEVYATTQTQATTPAAPTNLTASARSKSSIKLTWLDKSSNETGFKIERSLYATTGFSQIATVGVNITNYTNTGLSRNTTYYYRVRAYNSGGDSNYTNTASAKTLQK